MTNIKLADGDELCRVIEQVAELEWRKFQARLVEIVLKTGEIHREDNSRIPPFTSFRFKDEDPALVEKLRSAVANYKGTVTWHMFGHQRLTLPGTNWIIRPTFVEEVISEAGGEDWGSYIVERYPGFAPIAYADLLGLTKYVRASLGS